MAEINVNSSHNHSFSDYSGSSTTVWDSVSIGACSLAHNNCQVTSYTTRAFMNGGGTSTYYVNNYQKTGEININVGHTHSYSRKEVASSATGYYLLSSGRCAEDHSQCLLYYYTTTAATSLTTASGSSSTYRQTGEVRVYVSHTHTLSTLAVAYITTGVSSCSAGHANCHVPGAAYGVGTITASQTSGTARY